MKYLKYIILALGLSSSALHAALPVLVPVNSYAKAQEIMTLKAQYKAVIDAYENILNLKKSTQENVKRSAA